MRTFIVGFALAAPVLLIALWGTSPLLAVGVLAASHAFLLYPTLRPNVQWLGPVVTRFDARGKELWLTIDDGPGEDTPELLESLGRRNVKATFFVKGTLAAARPDLVRAILAAGHTVANHSQTHPSGSFWCLPSGVIAAEIDRCNEVLRGITGQTPSWFRAPVGMKNPFVHPLLQRRDMRLIGWTARAFDAVRSDIEAIRGRIRRLARPGAIIVMHQGQSHSVPCIEAVIDDLQADGYSFVVPEDGRLKTNR